MGSRCANISGTWPASLFLCCPTSGGGWRSILHNLRQDARIKLIQEGSVMGLKMALFMFAVHTSAEVIVKWTCLEELQQDWGPWCQNMSQLCPSRSHCCRPANEMFILFVLLWYFWYWFMVYFNKSAKQGVACFKCTTFNKFILALIFEGQTFKIYRSSTHLPFVASF